MAKVTISLSEKGVEYAITLGFLEQLHTGKNGILGFAPLEHINAVEIVQMPIFQIFPLFPLLFFLTTSHIVFYSEGTPIISGTMSVKDGKKILQHYTELKSTST